MSLGVQAPPHRGSAGSTPLVAAGLVLAVIVLYAPVAGHDFVNFDDGAYVYENAMVRAGLTWEGAKWAFDSVHSSNWHPLTWLSHMLDSHFFGLDAGKHHLVSVLFHAANAALLFTAPRRFTLLYRDWYDLDRRAREHWRRRQEADRDILHFPAIPQDLKPPPDFATASASKEPPPPVPADHDAPPSTLVRPSEPRALAAASQRRTA